MDFSEKRLLHYITNSGATKRLLFFIDKVTELTHNKRMKIRDVTNYSLSPNQRKEAEEYMKNYNVNEMMKKCIRIPKSNLKLAMEILIRDVKPIVCPHCGYNIGVNSYSNALDIKLMENLH